MDVWGWIHGYRALSPQLNWAWNEIAILERLFPMLPELAQYRRVVAGITQASNDVLFRVVEDLLEMVSNGRPMTRTTSMMEFRRQQFLEELLRERNDFVARHEGRLLRALYPDDAGVTAIA